MSNATLQQIGVRATKIATIRRKLDVEEKNLDHLMKKARHEGHSLRDIARAAGVTNVTVHNRTRTKKAA